MNREYQRRLNWCMAERRAIDAERPGAHVDDLAAWEANKQRRLNEIDAKIADLRSKIAQARGEFEKR